MSGGTPLTSWAKLMYNKLICNFQWGILCPIFATAHNIPCIYIYIYIYIYIMYWVYFMGENFAFLTSPQLLSLGKIFPTEYWWWPGLLISSMLVPFYQSWLVLYQRQHLFQPSELPQGDEIGSRWYGKWEEPYTDLQAWGVQQLQSQREDTDT